MKAVELTELGTQAVNMDLIEIKDGVPIANTVAIDAYLVGATSYVDDSIKNDLDVEIVERKIKEIKDVTDGFVDFRKSFTAPLDGMKKEFTTRESDLDNLRKRLILRREEMLETTYMIADEAIQKEFKKLQVENDNIVPDMTVFDSFISAQRKVKGMLPNDKDILGKASLEKIEKEFEKHIAPIREAQRLEGLKEKEQKQFEMYLENLNVTSDNINELEAVVVNLEKFKTQVAELYPNIIASCERTLVNKIGLAKGNINTLKALKAQHEAEDKTKQAEAKVEELHDADDEIITEINNIKSGLLVVENDKNILNEKLDRLRVLTTSMKYAKTLEDAKELATIIKTMISDAESKESQATKENQEIVSETFTVSGTIDDMKALVKFLKERGMSYE